MKILPKGKLNGIYASQFNRLLYELRTYGRASDIIWARIFDYVDLTKYDCEALSYMTERIIDALRLSNSIYEKASKYLFLAVLNKNYPKVVSVLINYALRNLLVMENSEEKMLMLSDAASIAYSASDYSLGDRIVDSIFAVGESLGTIGEVEAHIYAGRALYSKDLDESDTCFLKAYDMIPKISSKYARAILLTKLASYYREIFSDKVGRSISAKWFDESLDFRKKYALSFEIFVSKTIAYIYRYDELLGTKYLDALLTNLLHRKDWKELLTNVLKTIKIAGIGLEPIIKIQRWLDVRYSRRKILDEDYAEMYSYLISAAKGIDQFKAFSLLHSTEDIIIYIEPEKFQLALTILENIGSLDVALTYDLANILVRDLVSRGDLKKAIILLSKTQTYFPNKIDSIYRKVIEPKIKKMNIRELVDIVDILSKIGTRSIDTFLREIINRAESMETTLKAKIIGRIGVGLIERNYSWSLQLIDYLDEVLQDVPLDAKAEIYADIGIGLYRKQKKLGIEIVKKCIKMMENISPRKATDILTKIFRNIDDSAILPWIDQLRLYAAELKTIIKPKRHSPL